MPCLFVLDRPFLIRLLLAEVAANEKRRHHQEKQSGSNANRLARKEAEQRAGENRHGALDHERGGRPDEDGERPMPRREQQGGQRRLVGKLEQEDDREDGQAKSEGVRHADESSGLVPAPRVEQRLQ